MLVLLAVAAIAVLYCVVVVSQGRGGELTEFAPDVPPLDLPYPRELTAVDFMAMRLPVSLVGYHTQTVDETLQRAAMAISERDTHIAVLEQRVAELLSGRVQARQEAQTRPPYAAGETEPSRTGMGLAAAPHPLSESETLTGPGKFSRWDTVAGSASEPLAMPEEFPPPARFSGLGASRPPHEPSAASEGVSGLGTGPAHEPPAPSETISGLGTRAAHEPPAPSETISDRGRSAADEPSASVDTPEESLPAGEEDAPSGRHAASNGGPAAGDDRSETRDSRGGIAGA
ncbi:hypothetical protein [Sphaerisporangium dianthi]|uniref:DivIVA domain-containing protein n=1 Tax=Sphaerisporangium dianthi TaxID=1436120 RepID=A0ABV9CIE1_9ACTN